MLFLVVAYIYLCFGCGHFYLAFILDCDGMDIAKADHNPKSQGAETQKVG